ncbi:hypothetical protein HPB52_019328 [Rhipicephalus sanguineus]|uniref:Transmembrane protein n=1 Tax=Rhipicephalus sanguineus TaxID=34632 RepID=A0A9D4Q867_RHISA|nr:hypothetical protein HPB52_019328 [Rhipicephalus sanguineus]
MTTDRTSPFTQLFAGLGDTPTRPGQSLPVSSAPYPLVRLVRKGSTLSSQLHSPLHRGGSILTSPKHTCSARATSPAGAGSTKQDTPDTGPTCLRRTGSGDVIIGEVVLMQPRRVFGASGEGATDMVQVELDSMRESPPPRNGPSDEEAPLSWIKRGTSAGKVAAIVFVTIMWLLLVAGASTYYFIGFAQWVSTTICG